jgi:hypothetical protein
LIQFDPSHPQGPFHSARSLGNDAVIGKGNTGMPGMYFYRAILIEPNEHEVIVSVTPGRIENTVTADPDQTDTSPEAVVTYDSLEPAPDERVKIKPEKLYLNTGDTATWVVSGLEEGMFVTFHFETLEGGTSTNLTGPFASFSAMAGGAGEVRAQGTGFMKGAGASGTPPESIPAHFQYKIRVWNADGTPAGGHDPAIDNLGPPIPG